MRFLIVIVALLIALPARAICPTSTEGRDWSSWNVQRRGWHLPRRRAHRHFVRPRERIIERETLRYEHVIKQSR